MSETEEYSETSDTQLLTAEYKDGQLQIVEVAPFDKGGDLGKDETDMPILTEDGGAVTKFVQVVNSDKSVMQLDLLNLTLVRCDDGSESYRLVSTSEVDGSEATVACVLQSSDNEETMLTEADNQDTFVYMENDDRLVLYQSQAHAGTLGTLETPQTTEEPLAQPLQLTPNEILERAKAIQKSKAQIVPAKPPAPAPSRRGRKRKSELPPPHELLSSPNFKLFLYSCKLCSFKCNAVKEMTAHKAASHRCGRDNAGGKWKGVRLSPSNMQCGLCPYRGTVEQLMKHVQDSHSDETTGNNSNKVHLDTAEVAAADVLVCGACGFESASRQLFRRHIEAVHGATAC